MGWKRFLSAFAILYVIFAIFSYVIVTVGPLVACAFGLIFAACQSGNTLFLFLSVLVIPALIAIFTSPFMVDYINLRRERQAREELEDEERDADR